MVQVTLLRRTPASP